MARTQSSGTHLTHHSYPQIPLQAQFGWHEDRTENEEHWGFTTSMISVVILLSGHGSGMQMWGFQVFKYGRPGVAAAFPGAATHQSVTPAHTEGKEEVVKLSLFFD